MNSERLTFGSVGMSDESACCKQSRQIPNGLVLQECAACTVLSRLVADSGKPCCNATSTCIKHLEKLRVFAAPNFPEIRAAPQKPRRSGEQKRTTSRVVHPSTARFRVPFARSLMAFDTSVVPWRRHVGITVPHVARDRSLGLSRDDHFPA